MFVKGLMLSGALMISEINSHIDHCGIITMKDKYCYCSNAHRRHSINKATDFKRCSDVNELSTKQAAMLTSVSMPIQNLCGEESQSISDALSVFIHSQIIQF